MPPPPPRPPPPPPPPPPRKEADAIEGTVSGTQVSALFAEIKGKGDHITQGLRHVDDSEKVYKQKREVQAVSFEDLEAKKLALALARQAKDVAHDTAAGEAAAPAQVAVFELQGHKKWVVSHHAGKPGSPLSLTIEGGELRHSVYINKCEHLHLTIPCKLNSVAIVDSHNVQVSVKCIVASVEVTRSNSVDVQVTEALPSAMLDNSNCINLFLMDPERSRETEIVTSCCSTVNVNFPSKDDPTDLIEKAVAEQFVTKLVKDARGNLKLQTKPSEIC